MKIVAQVGHQLRVGGVVGRFDPDDPRLELAIVSLHVPEEVQLGHGRSDQQHGPVILQGPGHLSEEPRFVVRMVPHPHILLVGVTMNVRTGRVNDGLR